MATRLNSSMDYDFVVIGGGSAGLTAARFAARLGRRVAIIEAERLGGDCTWTGCVPSKALIRAARAAHEIQNAGRFGFSVPDLSLDYSALMGYVNRVIEDIYLPESPDGLHSEGIETFFGRAEFADRHTVRAGETTLRFRKLLLATGARPSIPPIPGLHETGYLTYETLWNLAKLPDRLLVIGGGPVGCEIAQSFNRLGSKVTLFEAADKLLPSEEPESSELIQSRLTHEGVDVHLSSTIRAIRRSGEDILVESEDSVVTGDELLVATGRVPNLAGLQLERAEVEYSGRGIRVDKHLRTSTRHILAAGDCTGGQQFTHHAGWQGFMAARNALLPGHSVAQLDTVPRATFTDPEVAQTGLTEAQGRARFGDSVGTAIWPMEQVDRAVIDGTGNGFLKVVFKKDGKLLGATLVSPTAGEIIQQWSLAISRGMKVGEIASTMHAYPTYSMAAMQLAAEHRVGRLLEGFSGKLVRFLSRRSKFLAAL